MEILNHPYFILAILVCILGEASCSYWTNKAVYDPYETVSNLVFISLDKILILFTGSDGGRLTQFLWSRRLFEFQVQGFLRWLILFFVAEFIYYCVHWYNHHTNLGWATHSMHHAPTKFNLTVGYRLGVTRFFSLGWLIFLPFVILGFPPAELVLLAGGILLYQFFIHTEFFPRLGPLEYVLNTPSGHRVHHANIPEFYNKNLGGITLIYDHLFGTYAAEPRSRVQVYGLPEVMRERKIGFELFHYWRALVNALAQERGIVKKVKLIFSSPSLPLPESRLIKKIRRNF